MGLFRSKPRTNSVKILKALSDDIRLEIVKSLIGQTSPMASCEVIGSCARHHKLTQPAMSHHFKKLVDSEVLILEKRGTENYYVVNNDLCMEHGIDVKKL